MKNIYNQLQIINNTITINIIVGVLDKFALGAFNKLAYNQEINRFFIINLLLGLPKYYIISCNVKLVNIKLLYNCFYKFAPNKYNQTRDENNFVML